jgi:hypothetical protein
LSDEIVFAVALKFFSGGTSGSVWGSVTDVFRAGIESAFEARTWCSDGTRKAGEHGPRPLKKGVVSAVIRG